MSYSLTILDNKITTTSGDLVTWVNSQGFIDLTELTTTSGDIVAQIPSLAGYATESWVNSQGYIDLTELTTTSGDIVSQIPSLAGYATESWVSTNHIDNSEMTTISGDIINQIPSDYITSVQLTTTSGDIVSQIPSLAGYATESWVNSQGFIDLTELTTTSGDIVAQIPSLAGYATESWVSSGYIDNSEITTISGDIVAQIGEGEVTLAQLTTTSGDIVDQIPSLAGYATESWTNANFIDNSEMTTISGDIVEQIGDTAGVLHIESLAFTQGTSSPAKIFTPNDNITIMRTQINLTTAASGSGASLTVGHSGDTDADFESGDIYMQGAALYEVSSLRNVGASPNDINLYITVGGQTFSGTVYMWWVNLT